LPTGHTFVVLTSPCCFFSFFPLCFSLFRFAFPKSYTNMEGGVTCIKYLLFLFNLLFVISGIALIVTAALIQTVYATYLDFLGSQFLSAPVLFIIVGVVIFLVAFFGCCGAVKESNCMMLTFSILLIVIFICEVAGGIAAYVLMGDVKETVETFMTKAMEHYDQDGYKATWDYAQHEGRCCGVTSYKDWFPLFNSTAVVPDSCCVQDTVGCGADISDLSTINQKGCLDEFVDQVKHNAGIFAGVGIGLAVIQLIGIVFACMLAKAIRVSYEAV